MIYLDIGINNTNMLVNNIVQDTRYKIVYFRHEAYNLNIV